jgi:acetoacetyl-[acyl-carrier protein] synthase
MTRLPIVVGFGGVNSAGRTSFHHGYRRMVLHSLSSQKQQRTQLGLAVMMGLVKPQNGGYQDQNGYALTQTQVLERCAQTVLDGTLIRKIEAQYYDIDAIDCLRRATIAPGPDTQLLMKKEQLPRRWADHRPSKNSSIQVPLIDNLDVLVPDKRASTVRSASQLPSGFDPGTNYASKDHPRGVQMAVYAASDAWSSVGISWSTLKNHIAPDEVAVYASSVYGQMDGHGLGGMTQAWRNAEEVSNKQIAMGLSSMPGDFVNAYMMGTLGSTGGQVGACATFLYNLQHAIQDIQSGRARVAIVGTSEAPITAEIVEGFRAANSLAQNDPSKAIDERKTSRPFNADNCGFTIGESAQYAVLFDDELAIELGACMYASVPSVFVNADGFKKSIYAPGAGNYLTLAKAAASAAQLIGREALQQRSYVQSHGTSTPLNRRTESQVMDTIAKTFGIEQWPVAAIKCYLGHSIASAAGDQFACSLGVWEDGWIPGIATMDSVSEDVQREHLSFSQQHREVGATGIDATLLNSKGFGGNNASAVLLSPHKTYELLNKRYSNAALKNYKDKLDKVKEAAADYDELAIKNQAKTIYQFNEGVIADQDLMITDSGVSIPGYAKDVILNQPSLYEELC